jgi:hypothetical protein
MGGDPFREQPSLDRDEPRAADARIAVPLETGIYRTPHVPVAFISIDLDYYSSTKEALKLLNCHTQLIGQWELLDAED